MQHQHIVEELTGVLDHHERVTARFSNGIETYGAATAIERYGEDVFAAAAQATLATHFFQARQGLAQTNPGLDEEQATRQALEWTVKQASIAIETYAGRRSTSPITQEQDRAALIAAVRFLQTYQPTS
jgi:hypothetical protein